MRPSTYLWKCRWSLLYSRSSPSFSTTTTSYGPPGESRSSAMRTGFHPSSIASRSSTSVGSSPHPAMSVPHRGLGDLLEELLVRLRRADLVDEHLHRGVRVQGVEHSAEPPHQGQLLL